MNNELLGINFGDCEIRSISFMDRSAYLRFFDPVKTTYFTVVFRSFSNLLFETNHFQNVIDSVQVFDTIEDLKNDRTASAFLSKVDQATLETKGLKFAYIKPIAGGETFISFTGLEVEE